jgi:phosphotransferase system HPr-like phosphotransfer protein
MMNFSLSKFLCCSALFFLFSCSSENPPEIVTNKPQEEMSKNASRQDQSFSTLTSESYSVKISPVDATRNSTLQVIAQGFKLSDAKIEWLLNGHPVISNSISQLNVKETQKGDRVQVKAIIQGKELMSNIIEIKNATPEITRVKILPEIFKSGDTLSVEASGNDADGDEVTIVYKWIKNGEPAGNDKRLEAPVKRGDKISVRITPFDGEINGQAVILNREIKNMPPMINGDNKFQFDGKFFSHQIKAVDPDGDVLTYSLKVAPAGMTINSSTGLIQWNAPQDLNKKIPITVSVTDGNGGEASQSFTLDIIAKARN